MRINPAFLIAIAFTVAATGCKSGESGAASTGSSKDTPGLSKLGIEDKVVGTGDAVQAGDDVWVRYTGKLGNGHIFDSNTGADKKPFHLTVGAGSVIKGWDQGLVGMKQGGKRKLSIPYTLAYGDKAQSAIPPRSDLYFDIDLVTVLNKNSANIITADDVKKGTGAEAKKGSTVTVAYEAIADGSTFETQKNARFTIGKDEMAIPNFDDAIIGMKVGGERKITVPPTLTRQIRSEELGMNVAVFNVRLLSVD